MISTTCTSLLLLMINITCTNVAGQFQTQETVKKIERRRIDRFWMASSDSKKTQILDLKHEASVKKFPNSGGQAAATPPAAKGEKLKRVIVMEEGVRGRERLKRRRREIDRSVQWIPESWGQETFLNGWKDCAVIDRSLFPTGLSVAREALVKECRKRQLRGQSQSP